MTRLFQTSRIDERKLTMLAHQIARQRPGRREWIHGKIHSADCDCRICGKAA